MLAMASLPMCVTGANLAFSAIEKSFPDASRATLSWALSGYSIVIAAFTLLGGQLSDRLGSYRMFVIGLIAFIVFNLAAATAPNAALLIAARVLQGAGGALIVPSSLALALARCAPERRMFTIGVWTASFPLGSSFAPIGASLLLGVWGWRSVFVAAGLVASVALGMVAFLGNHERGPRPHLANGLPDFLGAAIGTTAVGLAALAIVQGRSWGWLAPPTLIALGAAAALSPIFVRRSRRHERPLIDPDLFSIRSFRTANMANVLVSMVGTSTWLLWPLLMTNVWKFGQLKVGFAMTPTPVIAGLGSFLTARYAQRHGYRRMLVVGSVFLITSCVSFAVLPTVTPNYWTGIFPGLILMGVGMATTFAPLNGAALVDIPTSRIGQANAAFTTGRFLSGALGVAAVIAALSGTAAHPLDPFDQAFWLLALCALGAFVVLALIWDRGGRAEHRSPVSQSL